MRTIILEFKRKVTAHGRQAIAPGSCLEGNGEKEEKRRPFGDRYGGSANSQMALGDSFRERVKESNVPEKAE